MSIVTELELPGAEFALSETLRENPEAEFEIERVVAHRGDRVMPFVWVSGTTDFEAVGRSLQADETVAELEKRSSFEGEELYRMEWVTQIEIIVQLLLEEGASILNAYGTR